MIYQNLVDIGLETYLNIYFLNEEWTLEPYLEKLDAFVARKDWDQRNVFLRKFKPLTDHTSINDHLYELMIGAAFHPNGQFQENSQTGPSPDIIDNEVNIEVKNINAEPSEIERTKILIPGAVSHGPFPDDANFTIRFKEKFLHRVNKAKQQIANKGIIYIIWDTSIKGSTERKPKIQKLLDSLCVEEKRKSPDIEIITIDFINLRELVAKL